jgi:tRNA A37 methylthiotransferase MiaB
MSWLIEPFKHFKVSRINCQIFILLRSEGVKEIWLTSEDLGAWGRDMDQVLPDLLQELVKVIPEGCMMRLGMTNPPYILDYLQVQFSDNS